MMIELFLYARHFIEVFLAGIGHHQTGNLMIALEIFRLFFDTFGDKVIDATRNITGRVLLQTRDDQILFINNTPIVQTLFAVEDLHQGGFPGAVTPHQTDAFVIFDMQLCVIEKRRVAERQPCAMHTD